MGNAFQCKFSTQLLCQISGNGQSQTISLYIAVSGVLHGEKTIKDMPGRSPVNSSPLICHIQIYLVFLCFQKDTDIVSISSIADDIGYQIAENALQSFLISLNINCFLWQFNFHLKGFF